MEGVIATMTVLAKKIEAIGRDIIQCTDGQRKMCTGARNDQTNGYYPRSFFLEWPDASKVEVTVVGPNPGNASELEKEFYKLSARCNHKGMATYDDCARAWRAVAREGNYHKRIRHLLDEVGLKKEKRGILWTELAFCEGKNLSKKTLEHCCENFFEERISKLLLEGTYVFCVGKDPFNYVKDLPMEKVPQKKGWKIVGFYHPTPAWGKPRFPSYFVREKDVRLDSCELKPEIRKSFEKVKRGSPRFLGEE